MAPVIPGILFFCCCVLFSLNQAFAQRTFQSAPDSARPQSPQIIVTEGSPATYFTTKKVAEKTPLRTSIKMNPLLLLQGDIPVYIEQKVAKKLTIELGLGMTYDNVITDALDPDHYSESTQKENLMGYSIAAGLRYYPSSTYETMEGYYFAPEIRYRQYKSIANQYLEETIDVKQGRDLTDFKLGFGYVDFIEDRIFIDMYTGIGMRNRKYHNMVRDGETVYNGTTTVETYEVWNENKMVPLFSLGAKIGFAF
ncbi:DUF3575 domain-containing protein [Adhaeribacter sp. BT258]|uniref:DUF3575 domain-containing protein n=1 Tax=Adhaeribacter terrigena TaxID=2793070 RepID=A0ABS1C6A7_9BACT|nr:DUF3575 domain-containing protein [Adhaeribacter terrigena]MBK0404223.1 DUF3575 domain-containing protein [Adhaeribacter terrigena]